MHLHNRQIKAAFWTDTELIRELSRDGRMFYLGLIQLADDSGCLEDDTLAFKIHLFPADNDITLETLQGYRDTLVELGKLIPYEAQGKKCLFLKNFHKHQSLKNPNPPEVPLPEWIKWIPYESNPRAGKYEVSPMPEVGFRPEVTQPSEDDFLADSLPEESIEEERKKSVRNLSEGPVLQTSSNLELKLKEELEEELEEVRGEGCGKPNPPPSSQPSLKLMTDVTPMERAILHELKAVPDYPFDYTKDLEYVRTLLPDFPDLDILDEAKKWSVYKRDRPLAKKSNPRLQFRNWLEKAREFARERSARRGRGNPVGTSPPTSGKYDDLVIRDPADLQVS
ncbi:MAG: hypothetical protein HPY71_01485 [Firmicutes bacterium]|nr:hypothetical protein [Bacillota bacterium]